MKIGIIGAGAIGAVLAERLSAAGHDVAIANSRTPNTVDPRALSTGARAVYAADVTADANVVIVSVSIGNVPDISDLVRAALPGAVVIDTSNYYPLRDGRIPELDAGQVESLWVTEHYGRPVVKAWNMITAQSLTEYASAPGAPGRIAIAVAGDDMDAKAVAMTLVDQTGFDAVDSGAVADSWRQQPGTPAYCTDHTSGELLTVLDRADARRSARRRDLVIEVATERTQADGSVTADYLVRLNRAIY